MRTSAITALTAKDLGKAEKGSYYFIAGCGGELSEWTKGYEEILAEEKIGKPVTWYSCMGDDVNMYAYADRVPGEWTNPYPHDLVCLLFPLDGLDLGRLAMFKLRAGDRWFDDVVQNMRAD